MVVEVAEGVVISPSVARAGPLSYEGAPLAARADLLGRLAAHHWLPAQTSWVDSLRTTGGGPVDRVIPYCGAVD
jgi:hypothetical protein